MSLHSAVQMTESKEAPSIDHPLRPSTLVKNLKHLVAASKDDGSSLGLRLLGSAVVIAQEATP